jgi:hypothetical protein
MVTAENLNLGELEMPCAWHGFNSQSIRRGRSISLTDRDFAEVIIHARRSTTWYCRKSSAKIVSEIDFPSSQSNFNMIFSIYRIYRDTICDMGCTLAGGGPCC